MADLDENRCMGWIEAPVSCGSSQAVSAVNFKKTDDDGFLFPSTAFFTGRVFHRLRRRGGGIVLERLNLIP